MQLWSSTLAACGLHAHKLGGPAGGGGKRTVDAAWCRDRSARTVYRALPKTKGQAMDRSEANKITVPARGVVGFKPSPSLKESVKGLKRVKRARVAKKEKEIV